MLDRNHTGPLVSHLAELRSRLLKCLLAVILVFAGLFSYSQKIYTLIAAPLREYLPAGASMIATDVASPFLTPLKLTMVVALVLAMPVVLYQLWRFFAPGLYRQEKRLASALLISSVILFYTGLTFPYFLVFPLMFKFFADATPQGVAMMTDIASYLDFVTTLFLAFGAAFEIPVVIILVVSTGTVKIIDLKRLRPYVVIGCFVVAMVLTPPDIFSQTLLAVPMWLLYELGVLMGSLLRPSAASRGVTNRLET